MLPIFENFLVSVKTFSLFTSLFAFKKIVANSSVYFHIDLDKCFHILWSDAYCLNTWEIFLEEIKVLLKTREKGGNFWEYTS